MQKRREMGPSEKDERFTVNKSTMKGRKKTGSDEDQLLDSIVRRFQNSVQQLLISQ